MNDAATLPPLVEGGQINDHSQGRERVISIRGLRNQFGANVLHDRLDFDVFRGEIVGLVGGSGSGKSVLLRTIVGLNPWREGRIEVFGEDMGHLTADERSHVQTRWGVLFQDGALFSSLSVIENIELPLREHARVPEAALDDIAALKISLVGLPPGACAKKPSELSGGMKKRAGLARALALDAELLFLDEPTAGLDPISASNFDSLLRDLQRTLGLTVVMVTHDLDSLNAICDRVAVLLDKRIVAGTMEELLAYDHPWTKEYFHGPRARAAGIR
ncbi:ATP-binding cassette domain-containing protein [Vineibacter terrae]|uniref:ATP-binding cassette domain-containing protein n=1 Tax=Vineibacter terrae TaxID=2586908 RepID=A0A5C8PA63_9HYPH|nr:ATP-binding cassette domain-containing protein [Vineibacter terrae]TXL70665.1 ATP-binding cassette domain-containing protein [Vineibacter terrae]